LGNAALGAGAALATGGLAKTMGRAGQRMRDNPTGRSNLGWQEDGLHLTPGQVYGNRAEAIERGISRVNPTVNKAMRKVEDQQLTALHRAAGTEPPTPQQLQDYGTKTIMQGAKETVDKYLPAQLAGIAKDHPWLSTAGVVALTPLTVKQLAVLGGVNLVGGKLVFNNSLRQRLVGLAADEQAKFLNSMANSVPKGALVNQAVPDDVRQAAGDTVQQASQQVMGNLWKQKQRMMAKELETLNLDRQF
jgi:hypothetical protein